MEDHWIDYEVFSETIPDESFPRGANWLMLGPSGPRRLRLAVEHLAQHRGGICFCVDLDPRWVVKLIKKGKIDEAKAYSAHVIDQAMTILATPEFLKPSIPAGAMMPPPPFRDGVRTSVIYLTVVYIRLMRGKYDDGNYNHLEVAGLFWHFVDLVWIFLFPLLYLIGRH